MGYRSDFKLSTNEKGKEILSNKVGKWIKQETDSDYWCFEWEHQDLERNHFILSGTYLKMYDGFDEIDALNDAMDEMDEKDISYHYVRLGEDFSDVEERYEEHDDTIIILDLIRDISY